MKLHSNLFFILIALFVFNGNIKLSAQNIDSLYRIINKETQDTATVRALNALSWEYLFRSPDTASMFIEQAIELSKKLDNDFSLGLSYMTLGTQLTAQTKLEEGKTYLLKSLELVKNSNDTKLLGQLNLLIGLNFLYAGNNDSCIFYNQKANKYYTIINSTQGLYSTNNNIGVAYLNQSYYELATGHFIAALKYIEQLDNENELYNVYINIASAFLETGNIDEGLKYLHKMDVENENITDKRILGYMIAIYALYYTEQNQYNKAIAYNLKAIKSFELVKIQLGVYDAYHNLVENYLALGKLDSARYYIQTGLKAIQNDNAGLSKAQMLFMRGEYFLKLKDYPKAIRSFTKAVDGAKEVNHLKTQKEAYQKLAEVYELLHKPDLALDFFKNYQEIKDSLMNEDKQKQIAQINIKYETEKIEQENKLLVVEKEMALLEVEKRKKQNLIIAISSISLLLVLALAISIISLRRKKEQHEAKINELKAKDEERNMIADKLHDGIKYDLSKISKDLKKSGQFELGDNIEEVAMQIRELSHELKTIKFEERAFEDQIKDLISDNISEDLSIKHNNLSGIDWKVISDNTKKTLYLVVREAVCNISKHSGADEAKINFSGDKNKVSVTITDNGIGFNQDDYSPGLGLRNMEARVNMLNGEVKITSQKNKGTKLFIQMMI